MVQKDVDKLKQQTALFCFPLHNLLKLPSCEEFVSTDQTLFGVLQYRSVTTGEMRLLRSTVALALCVAIMSDSNEITTSKVGLFLNVTL